MRFDLFLKLQDLQIQQRELQAQAERDGLSAYRGRLQAAQDDLQSLRERAAYLDEKLPEWESQSVSPEQQDLILQAMLELEELPERLRLAEEALAEAEQDWQEAQPEERERLQALQARLLQNEQEQSTCAEHLGSEAMLYYNRAREAFAKPVVEVKSGRCPSCRMELSQNEQRQLRLGFGQPCSTCQIVLVAARSGLT